MAFTPKDWKNAPDHSTPLSAEALEDLETRVTDPMADEGMGVIVHGATAGTARGTLFKQYTWVGTVEPSNMVDGDIWVDVS